MLVRTLILTFAFFAATSSAVFARLKIPVGERDVVNQVLDLPDTEEYKDGLNYLDLAVYYREFNIAYILPLYVTQEPTIVLYEKEFEKVYEIPEEKLSAILEANNLKKEELLSLPFYTKYGGKVVAALIIGLIIWGVLPSKGDKNSDD